MAMHYIVIAVIGALSFASLFGVPKSAPRVGTRPGNIGKASDIDADAARRSNELATFAAGCFWGVEASFREVAGVVATAVGYTGGRTDNPTYEQVCAHHTGHAEAILIEFDPELVSYEQLLEHFFLLHDATYDRGSESQYRSVIFFRNEAQKKIAEALVSRINLNSPRRIFTSVIPASRFWLAEEYHQQYEEKTGSSGCGF